MKWFLSIDGNDLPDDIKGKQPTYRTISSDGQEIEFSKGFTDLHTVSYQNIIEGNGFGLNHALPSIRMVGDLNDQLQDVKMPEDTHVFLKKAVG